MLIVAGMGVHDVKDVPLKTIEAAEKADLVYAEFYTSLLTSSLKDLERVIGRNIELLERSDLEENSGWLIEKAREKDVLILVPGDPMIATTHSALILEAKKAGVNVRIIHASSITSAVCITGLQFYRFGRTATVSYRVSRYPVDVVEQNWKINAHTLLLLDLHPEPMRVPKAIDCLFKAGMENWFAVALADAGGENYMKCDKLDRLRDFNFPGLHSLVVIAKTLHVVEYEYLREFASAPKELESIVD